MKKLSNRERHLVAIAMRTVNRGPPTVNIAKECFKEGGPMQSWRELSRTEKEVWTYLANQLCDLIEEESAKVKKIAKKKS